jgi:hypothetical protein
MPEQNYPVGIAGVEINPSPRNVPDNEPPALPSNEQLKVIGKPTPRLDGKAKVTGAAKYTADINLPGMLFARMICSPHPHARIQRIDTAEAERAPGVKAIHILDRLLGVAQERDKKEQTNYPLVRFAGQPIAAIAADTQHHADEAARLVRVEYEVLPFVVDIEKARQADAPTVFDAPAEQSGTAGGGGKASNEEEHAGGKDMHIGYFRGVANPSAIRDAVLERLRKQADSGLGDPDDVSERPDSLMEAARTLAVEAAALRAAAQTKLLRQAADQS